jgi:ComF family protein
MLRSWAVFDSPVQDGLHALKYRGNLAIGEGFALQMLDFVRSLPWKVDLIIPMPLGQQRLKDRGYNQVAVVAQPLAYFAGFAYTPQALWKSRETRSQVGLNIHQRQQNVQNVYQADPRLVGQKSVLLMDDVATTGSTISSSTEALLSAGAREVYAITIARALSHHSLNRV